MPQLFNTFLKRT
uniref:Uncharacterized protein n=1 Tax=Anguilla anguilla TaxID=7936 RepID=A0A0E9VU19_ANGAN